ncbi:MAG: YgeY family selenium metabolism-linked hydrolase [Thermodesulfobacteriota bacterium]
MDIAKEVRARAEGYREYTIENLSKLVKIKSLSLGEAAVQKELKAQMEAAGMDEVRVDGLGNVIGRIGSGSRILALDAHMDTVDVGNPANWDFDPFSGTVKDGYLLGRGSADQKGGAASFLTAARILKDLGFDRDLTLYFVGSIMEEDCDGLCWDYIIREEGLRPDTVIVTEPTGCNVYRGQRGRMEIEATFNGVSAHGSTPDRGKNAIYMAARTALAIEALHRRLPSDPFLGKGSVTVTEFVSDSPSLCAVADFAKIHVDRRLTWGETKESAVAEIEAIIEEMGLELDPEEDAWVSLLTYDEASYTGMQYAMDKYYPTWKIPEDHPAIQTGVAAHRELFGKAPRVDKWTFSTNAVTITGLYDIPTVGYGPGDEVYAHAPNEKVPVEELVKAAAFYALYAYRF